MSRLRKSILGTALLSGLATAASLTPLQSAESRLGSHSPAGGQPALAGKGSAEDLYILCGFYPKPGTCERVYQRAMKDRSIAAQAVRAEYLGYARYLNGAGSLTEADRQYLKDNGIRLPYELAPANQAGLHNVINDPSLPAASRPAAVNNFLSRATQAELFCRFNSCGENPKEPAAAGV